MTIKVGSPNGQLVVACVDRWSYLFQVGKLSSKPAHVHVSREKHTETHKAYAEHVVMYTHILYTHAATCILTLLTYTGTCINIYTHLYVVFSWVFYLMLLWQKGQNSCQSSGLTFSRRGTVSTCGSKNVIIFSISAVGCRGSEGAWQQICHLLNKKCHSKMWL